MYAVKEGHRDTAELLIQKGADVNLRDSHGCSLLNHAVMDGHRDIAELFLQNGADVNLKGDGGCYP